MMFSAKFKDTPLFEWAPDKYTLLSALFIVLAFPPWNLWPLIWISLVPWFAALNRAPSQKHAIIQGVWLSCFMSLGGFYWVAFAIQEFGNLPWVLSFFCLLLFSLLGQPQFFLLASLLKKVQNQNSIVLAILFAFLYAGVDWIMPKIFVDTLGHAFYRAVYLRQIADLGGPALLTFLVFFVNQTLWQSLWRIVQKQSADLQSKLQAGLAVVLILGSWTYGYFRVDQIHFEMSQSTKGIHVAAIQANIGDFEKIASESGVKGAAHRVLDTFTFLTDQALGEQPRPDMVIWPETSYPSSFRSPRSNYEMNLDERIESYVRSIQTPLLFGGYDHAQQKEYNSFFFLSPNGQLQTYHKSILLLFGEYIPGSEQIPFIKNALPQVANFGRGLGPTSIPIETTHPSIPVVQMGPLICYEVLFTNFVIDSARKGSQVLLNITNDSWFGTWGEPQLHLALSIFRSIETRLPLVRSTNTGISALVLPTGEITHPTDIGVQSVLKVFVPITPPIPTLMKSWGDWFGIFSLILGVLGSLVALKLGIVFTTINPRVNA